MRTIEFSGKQYMCISDYDSILRLDYGDYMQFPPVEQRIEKHNRAYLNIHEKETREEIRKKVDFRI